MRRYWVLGIVGMILAVVGGGIFGFDQWSKSDLSGSFVSTDDAQVVADMVQVGSLNAGRIVAVDANIGSSVMEGQVIATVDIPTLISRSDITNTAKMGFRNVQDQLSEIVAPRSGVIAARWAKEGDTVSADQAIVTLMDPSEIWIVANIDEDKIGQVQIGQLVEVEVESLNQTFVGRVDAISPVTAATLDSASGTSSSPSMRIVAQVIPIKVTLDEEHLSLIPGSSVNIKIWVRNP